MTLLRGNAVLLGKLGADLRHRGGSLEQFPDVSADLVEAVVAALFGVEHHQLFVDGSSQCPTSSYDSGIAVDSRHGADRRDRWGHAPAHGRRAACSSASR